MLLKDIKNDLTVNPFCYGDFKEKIEKRFSLFMESPNSLYLPRFYAQEHFGLPDDNKISYGNNISIPFNGKLRDEQKAQIKDNSK